MNHKRTRLLISACMVTIILLSACGPAQAEMDAAATQAATGKNASQTAQALDISMPTNIPTLTDTPPPPTNTTEPTYTPFPPTRTPVPTYPRPPTATPFPDRDPKAMIAWKELGLPIEYEAYSPEVIGMEEGANAFTLSSGEEYNIAGSFLFANGENPDTYIYGYTVLLPTSAKRGVFDQLINEVNYYGELEEYVLVEVNDLGSRSNGVTGKLDNQNLTIVAFRIDNIGAVVFLRHDLSVDPGIDAVHVARVYAKSIDEATPYCKITSVKPVLGADIPTFEVKAEGFYPQEGRFIMLDGAIEIEGETITIGNALLGGTGETFDPYGGLSDAIGIDLMQKLAAKGNQDVQLPDDSIEFTLTVGGHLSHCEATQTILWP